MAVPEAWDSTRVVNLESFDTLGVSLRLELAEAWDIVREFRRRKWRDALSGTLFSRLWANTGAMVCLLLDIWVLIHSRCALRHTLAGSP